MSKERTLTENDVAEILEAEQGRENESKLKIKLFLDIMGDATDKDSRLYQVYLEADKALKEL